MPTEAEWKYACRAGRSTAFYFGEKPSLEQVNYSGFFDEAGYADKALQRMVEVKHYKPNDWGLYEMHGNVWEWCEDYYQQDLGAEPATGPLNTQHAAHRVLRGGGANGGRNVR